MSVKVRSAVKRSKRAKDDVLCFRLPGLGFRI